MISYSIIQRETALRSAQLIGVNQATLEAAYSGSWASALDGAEIPLSSFKNQILNIESELAQIIAADSSHPYRTYIYGRSATLANLAGTPSVGINNDPFIGVFDSCADADTSRPLTLMPTETLTDYDNAFFDDTELWNYSITGNTIQHTRPNGAYLQGCIWNRTTQGTAYDANGSSPLPPILANTWIAGVLANIIQVGWADGAAATAANSNLYQQGIQILRLGTNVNIPLASRNMVSG